MLEDETVHVSLLYDVQQLDDIFPAVERHEDLDFPVNLFELDCMRKSVLGLSIFTTHF